MSEGAAYRSVLKFLERAEKAEREVERLTKEHFGLTTVIIEMLASADCTWEERNEGHDWREACDAARAALRGGDCE